MHKFMRNLIIAVLFLSLNSCQKHESSKKDTVKKSEKPLDEFEKTELQVLEENDYKPFEMYLIDAIIILANFVQVGGKRH